MLTLTGRRYLVFGVAMQRSICWPISHLIKQLGGEVVLSCHPGVKKFVDKLTTSAGMAEALTCDVSNKDDLDGLFAQLAADGKKFDGIVHGIAYSDTKELQGRYTDTSVDNFLKTMHVSCFSLTEIVRRAEPLLADGASIITLTFEAAYGYYPHYNVMALTKAALNASIIPLAVELGERRIRVNAVSASPENTPAARGIKNFEKIGRYAEANSPEGRRATLDEIANAACFLLSPMSSGITGQVIYVDCGLSIVRMAPPRHARLLATAMNAIADIHEGKPSEAKQDE